jgi:hypothetical protein
MMTWITLALAVASALAVAGGAVPPVNAATSNRGPAARDDGQDSVMVCVVRNGQLAEVRATVDGQTGDTLVNGRPFAELFPAPQYLAAAAWAARGEWVIYDRRRYISYGTPRVLPATDLVRVGEYRGVPLFARNLEGAYRSVYLPTRPGCEFQLYHYNATVGEVRG